MYKEYIEGKKAAFFDLDGTLIDSLPLWEKAYDVVLRSLDKKFCDLRILHQGTDSTTTWKYLIDTYEILNPEPIPNLVTKTNQEYLKIIQQTEIDVREGFYELYVELKYKRNFKTALISNSLRNVVDVVLNKLDVKDMFDLTITGDEVKHRKPDPEIFLTAASKLNLKPSEVLVFEDSVKGATAAKKAKMSTIIIWDGQVRELDYPEKMLDYFTSFKPLIGHLDHTYMEYARKQVQEEEAKQAGSK